jgi:hypothetical protein
MGVAESQEFASVPLDPNRLPRVPAQRTSRERTRDALAPLWRRALWVVAVRRTGARIARPGVYTTPVRVNGPSAERAREIYTRRLMR